MLREGSIVNGLKIAEAKEGVELWVHAKPRASRSAVRGVDDDGALVIALAAPPVDGEANDELVRFLARAIDVPKRAVRIVRGDRGRHKCVHIANIAPAELRARLTPLLVP